MKALSIFVSALVLLAGCPAPVTPPAVVPAAPDITSFTTSAVQVDAGQTVKLEWTTTNATSVTLVQLDKGALPIDGAQTQGAYNHVIENDVVFVLTARGEGGSDSAITSVGINAPPDRLLFAAVPGNVQAGESASLVWSAPGATTVTLTGNGAPVDLKGQVQSGTVTVTPSLDTTYVLDVDGRKATATVTVQPAIFSFTSEGSPAPGGMVALSWQTGGATKLTLTREGVTTPLLIETDATKISIGGFTDPVPATLPADAVLNYTLVIERGANTVTRKAVVYVGAAPKILDFQMPAYAQVPGSFNVSWKTANADRLQVSFGGLVVYDAPTKALVDLGNAVLPTPSMATQVELRATNARGGVLVQTKTISPVGAPVAIEFKADKAGITNGGEPVKLSWKITNARHVKIEIPGRYVVSDQTGQLDEGSLTVYPNQASTTYQLTADNQVGGSVPNMTVAVTVVTPAKFTLSVDSAPQGALIQVLSHNVPGGSNEVTGLATIAKNAPGEAFVDILTTGTDIAYSGPDTTAKLFTLPAPFSTTIYGVPVTGSKLSISINGWFKFSDTAVTGADNPTAANPPLPSASLDPLAIVPYWEDLYQITSNPLCKILVQVDTVGVLQRLIVQWNEVEHDDFTGSKMTFQAQVYSNGKVVFAYKTMQGLTGPDEPSVGIVNSDESDALVVNVRPAENDTYSLFADSTLPATVAVQKGPITGFVKIPPSGFIELTSDVVLPPNQFRISEANYNPAAGNVEWLEITNYASTAIELAGWAIDVGGGSTHTIVGPLVLPANGTLLLGQTADAAEASSGGPVVDYVYGTGIAMPDAAGTVALTFGGSPYSRLSWSAPGTAGVSLQPEKERTDLIFATGVTELMCVGVAPYGGSGQLGTPKAANPACFPWTRAPGTGVYQSIISTGAPVGSMVANNVLNSSDAVVVPLNFVAAGGRAVKIGNQQLGTAAAPLYVTSDGYVSLQMITTSTSFNPTIPAITSPNAVLAVFWDNLSANPTASGVYWQQFDPDTIPGNADDYTLISWENWRVFSSLATNLSSLNFQLKIHEATGDFEYIFGAMGSTTASGSTGALATTWFEAADGRSAIKVNVNSATAPGIQPGNAFRFVYAP